jgi:choline dehydrogenase-like flavoprotein
VRNRARRYGLEFHSEQWPNKDCRICLGQENDALGLPRLRINYYFTPKDTSSVVDAHNLFDLWLRENNLGYLDYRYDRSQLAEGVLEEANHGVHQIGTIRMAITPDEGCVDSSCKAFGTDNLYVAGTAVLPTSGQANPTFTAALLALRLADHLVQSQV